MLLKKDWFDSESRYIKTALSFAACGAPLITDGHPLLNSLLGPHFTPVGNDDEAAKRYQELEDMHTRERQSIALRQSILQEHAHLNRFEQLLKECDIARRQPDKISVIMSTMRQKAVEDGINNVAAQAWPNKELILILHRKKTDFDTEAINTLIKKLDFNVVVIDRDKNSVFGENLNLALDAASGDFITKMDDDDHYGPNHLHDLHLAYSYAGALAVGKWANFVYLTGRDVTVDFVTHREERFVRHLPGATVFMKRSDARGLLFGRVTRAIDSELYRRSEMRGGRLYSTHRYNFIRVRHNDHTYAQDEEDFIAHASSPPRPGLDKEASFI